MFNVTGSILIQKLLAQKTINNNDIELLKQQASKHQTISLALVIEDIMSIKQLCKWSCILFDVQPFDIAHYDFNQWPFYSHPLIHQQSVFLRTHQILPISLHNQNVILASADPSNLAVQNDFEFNTGLHSEFVCCDPIVLQQKISELIAFKPINYQQTEDVKNSLAQKEGAHKKDTNYASFNSDINIPINTKVNNSNLSSKGITSSDINRKQQHQIKDSIQSIDNQAPQLSEITNSKDVINSKATDLNSATLKSSRYLNTGSTTNTETVYNPEQQQTDPIIVYVDNILRRGIEENASDLHFEPYENNYRIRFRIDGVLINTDTPPANLSMRLAARIKVMANMDIAEKRKPQDGRLKLHSKQSVKQNLKQNQNSNTDHDVEFRVSTLPTIWGEKVVLRILDSKGNLANVNTLGFEPLQQQSYINALSRPQGLILVTGPTGSGKTLTLYSGLNFLNTEDKNISTIEDPVEYHLPGINQVQVNTKAQLDFASSLRAFLRQDPDVVMVGEIRDLDTAEIAIKAAHTGHLVLSTLHTNSAAETLNRLVNMGIPTYNLASAISLIIAQRLVRCLCEYCKVEEDAIPSEELIKQGFELEQLPEITLYKPLGCKRCNQGYKGRVSIFELLKPDSQIRQQIMQQASAAAIHKTAVSSGMVSLRQAGLNKVISGVTSLDEINRVTSNVI